jgi:STAM-binding protein
MRSLSISEMTREAQDFEFGSYRPLKAWLRSAQLLMTEAGICEQDGDLQKAYIYLIRYQELVLTKLPQHTDFRNPKYKSEIKQAMLTAQTNFTKLEQWKPKLVQRYERHMKSQERRDAAKQRVQEERLEDERQRMATERRSASLGYDDATFDDRRQTLSASEFRQLAVDLAHREIRRRDATKQSTRQAGISPGTVAERRRGFVAEDEPTYDMGETGDGVREAGRYLHEPGYRQSRSQQKPTTSSYYYPSVPAKEAAMNWTMPALQPRQSEIPYRGPPPAIPAKESLTRNEYSQYAVAPAIPPKQQDSLPPSPPTATPSPQPTQSKYTFKPGAYTESGAPLRTVMLPPELRTTFLNLADANTCRNLETCGILCGTVISNALFINHLIIPDQHSTSDTCDTTETGDNDLFDYCDANNLLVCGWIHTHPSQSCFLSSRDLHTSSGYQIMLPEAIAIVCAPRHNPDWGIFRLTSPPGLEHVLKCERKGLFHPHEETNLYTDASRPGHVVEGPGLNFEIVDLRKK